MVCSKGQNPNHIADHGRRRTRSLYALAVFALLTVFVAGAQAQISPGPLSAPHRALDGATGCTQCHAVSTSFPEFRCLECHQDIATRLQHKRGLHLVLMGSNTGGAACVRCHSEHNGEDFSIVRWDPSPARFDHSKTGFVLDGKHTGLNCNRCHVAQHITAPERKLITVKDLNRTFLGLSPGCSSCHEDKHQGRLGANCLQCHNTTDWKAAQKFDHSKTRYPLTGAHLQVPCQKCHTPGPEGAVRYTGLKFDRCTACHSDPHKENRAEFQHGCESCHNTSGWKRTSFLARFDHSTTKYPLLGKHAEVACDGCHRRAGFKATLAYQYCADCHKPDPHGGQFAKRADRGRCESCHTVDGFKPAKFTVTEHAQTGFPLRAKHATVACAKCHAPAGRATVFKLKFAACMDCHQDAHGAQFALAPYLNRCEQCHTESTFHPSTFTLAKHQQTRFPLNGGHVATACVDCHKPAQPPLTVAYHFQRLSCTTCHADPHRNQFVLRMAKADASGRTGCEVCHSVRSWKDTSRFDHDSTNFRLLGSHRGVECAGCHRPPNLERKLLNVDFKAAPSACEACHQDPHGAQFAHAGSTRCAQCHNSLKWRPSLFDHNQTRFSLKGAHQNVRCSGCHVNFRNLDGKQVLFYKPTPVACAACHSNAGRMERDDEDRE